MPGPATDFLSIFSTMRGMEIAQQEVEAREYANRVAAIRQVADLAQQMPAETRQHLNPIIGKLGMAAGDFNFLESMSMDPNAQGAMYTGQAVDGLNEEDKSRFFRNLPFAKMIGQTAGDTHRSELRENFAVRGAMGADPDTMKFLGDAAIGAEVGQGDPLANRGRMALMDQLTPEAYLNQWVVGNDLGLGASGQLQGNIAAGQQNVQRRGQDIGMMGDMATDDTRRLENEQKALKDMSDNLHMDPNQVASQLQQAMGRLSTNRYENNAERDVDLEMVASMQARMDLINMGIDPVSVPPSALRQAIEQQKQRLNAQGQSMFNGLGGAIGGGARQFFGGQP